MLKGEIAGINSRFAAEESAVLSQLLQLEPSDHKSTGTFMYEYAKLCFGLGQTGTAGGVTAGPSLVTEKLLRKSQAAPSALPLLV